MEPDFCKEKATDSIEAHKRDLFNISFELYSNPEIAYQEFKASKLLKDYLANNEFAIEHNIGGVETAFRASFGKKKKGPTVAFVAEFDALPGIGHGCGHNLIAAGAVGAGIGVTKALQETNLDGAIQIIGTPAEDYTEGKQGKIRLLESGAFDNLSAALMFHPWVEDAVIMNDLGCVVLDVKFEGRTAHAAADPWNGRNALDAVVMTYNGLSMLRQQIKSEARIHIIIPEGGRSVNVIPEKASARIMYRSMNMSYLEELGQKIAQCAEGASLASGTEVLIQEKTRVLNTKFNDPLFKIVSSNCELFGIKLKRPDCLYASSDFGNVSHRTPALAFFVKTHEENTPWHSVQVRDGSIRELAQEGMVTAAKILAMSAVDLIKHPELMASVTDAFGK